MKLKKISFVILFLGLSHSLFSSGLTPVHEKGETLSDKKGRKWDIVKVKEIQRSKINPEVQRIEYTCERTIIPGLLKKQVIARQTNEKPLDNILESKASYTLTPYSWSAIGLLALYGIYSYWSK